MGAAGTAPESPGSPASADPFTAALAEGHPWTYEVSGKREEGVETWSFRSVDPYPASPSEKVYLRFEVSRRDFTSEEAGRAAFDQLAVRADPDTGLTYAWDFIALDGRRLWRLHAPCLYSPANFKRLATNLVSTALEERKPRRTLRCRCGAGCEKSGS